MKLIDDVVETYRHSRRAAAAHAEATDALDTYLTEHPDIRAEADVMDSNALADAAIHPR